ncbi:MAG: hypothetical protein V7677_17105, partial [Motiliproteus sp.]
RARLSALAMPMLEQIPGKVFQQLMKQQLSEITGVSSDFFQQIAPPPATSAPSYPDNHYSDDDHWHQDNRHQSNRQQHNSPQPRQNSYRPQQALRPSSLGSRALRWLLHHPKLALKVDFETTEALSALMDPELSLLRALVEQLRPNPALPTALILMEWQDDPNYSILCQLTEQELLIADDESMEAEFIACLHQLMRKTEEAKLDYLKRKKSPPLTDDEKRLLNKLLLQNQRPRP